MEKINKVEGYKRSPPVATGGLLLYYLAQTEYGLGVGCGLL